MTTTELIKLLKKYEFGGATGRPREVSFQINNGIIGTDDIEVVGTGDGLVTELFLSLPSAERREDEWCKDCKEYDQDKHCCPRFNRVIREALDEVEEQNMKKARYVLCKSDGTLTIEVPKEEFEGATRILLCEEGTKFVTIYYPSESEEDDD